jgi:hypothetical protein
MSQRGLKSILLLVASVAFAWSLVLFVQQDATPHFTPKFATAVAIIILSVWPSIVPEARQHIYQIAACLCGTVLVVLLADGLTKGGPTHWWTVFAVLVSGTVGFTLLTTRPLITAGAIVLFVGVRLLFAATVWLWVHG